jgi:sugar phosphate isomerase/epimerase
MKLSTVTNEVLPDVSPNAFPRIFETISAEGIRDIEIRVVEGKRFPVVESDAWERLKTSASDHDVSFSAVSPGLFKAPLNSDLLPLHRNGLLNMSLDLAERMEIDTLIVFGVQRNKEDTAADMEKVIEILGEASDQAEKRGFSVQLENIPGSWADTGDNCLALLKGVGRSNFGYVWDTGNLYEAEQKHFHESYEKLKPYIKNVHLKDGQVIDGVMTWQHFGTGVTDIAGQVSALKADGYQGKLVIEAACNPHLEEDFTESVRYLKSVL